MAGMAWRGKVCPDGDWIGPMWQGRRGEAEQGVARSGEAWQGRRGMAWRGWVR